MRTRQVNYLSLVDNFIHEIQKPKNALGDYSDSHKWHFEFQIGAKLAWIVFDKNKPYKETVFKNLTFLREVWLNGQAALEIAETQSREVLKNFWVLQDRFDSLPYPTDKKHLYNASMNNKDTNRLDVNGILINLDDRVAAYDVFENYSYEYDQEKVTFLEDDYYEENPIKVKPPELPDDCWINIEYKNGKLMVV